MDNGQPNTHGLEQQIVDLYVKQGQPINQVCQVTGESYAQVTKILKKNDVKILGRGTYTLRGADHPSSKLSHTGRQDLENELLAGRSHGPLAKAYNLSRERVRQIAEAIGAPSGRELQLLRRAERIRKKEAEKAERQRIRELEKEERYKKWRELWRKGYTVPQMAKKLGLNPGSVSVRVVNLRKKHPTWFPKRNSRHA